MVGGKVKEGKDFSWKVFKSCERSSAEVKNPLSNVVQIIVFVFFERHPASTDGSWM